MRISLFFQKWRSDAMHLGGNVQDKYRDVTLKSGKMFDRPINIFNRYFKYAIYLGSCNDRNLKNKIAYFANLGITVFPVRNDVEYENAVSGVLGIRNATPFRKTWLQIKNPDVEAVKIPRPWNSESQRAETTTGCVRLRRAKPRDEQ